MPSTPPPTSLRARTPPTPFHGPQYDTYEPYSPRRSTRTTAQNHPYSSTRPERSTPPPFTKRARFARTNTQLSSPPSSPGSPVRVRATPRKAAPVSHSGALSDSDHRPASLAVETPAMLATPSKTPQRRTAASLHANARPLNFQRNDPNDVMPSARKIKKHGRHHSMNGFDLFDEEHTARADDIPIFTDVNARVPEVDEAEDNPFLGNKKSASRPPRRNTRRGKEPSTEDGLMAAAARNDEGVVYVFRGKRIFRRFSDPSDDRTSSAGTDRSDMPGQRSLKRKAGVAAQRPLTRSAIKPRLLFPSEDQVAERLQAESNDVDEEATTDIEMGNALTPEKKAAPTVMKTPAKPRFQAATPPPSSRRTRSAAKQVPLAHETLIVEEDEFETMTGEPSASLSKRGSASKSVFASWQRTKTGRKRALDDKHDDDVVGKRTRSAAVESPV